MTEALVEPTSVRMAPGFSAGAISCATAPDEPTGTETMTRSASRTASLRIGRVAVAEPEFLGARQRRGAAGRDGDMAGQALAADDARQRRADQADADQGDLFKHRFSHGFSFSGIR